MYPERDHRADEFDAALERLHSGERADDNDPELHELLSLATRLERDLPKDLPDPAFRARLKRDLIANASTNSPQPDIVPVELASRRWQQRLNTASWRAGAVAAALTVVVIGALALMLSGALGPGSGGDTDATEDSVAMPAAVDDTPDVLTDDLESEDDPPFSTFQAPETPADQRVRPEYWSAATLPPFDGLHIVLAPLSVAGGSALALESANDIQWTATTEMPDLPETAPVYFLAAPPNPSEHLSHIQAVLDIDGEVVPGNHDTGEPYRIVNGDGEPVVVWDVTSAFFQYWGDLHGSNRESLADDTGDLEARAREWLETVGFDLWTVEYDTHIVDADGNTTVRFDPVAIPALGMDLDLGAQVTFDAEGRVRSANGFWLSMVGMEEMPMMESDEAWDRARAGHGYWPPFEMPSGEDLLVEVREIKLVHLLTRLDETTYVLQPAVKFIGQYATREVPGASTRARYYVAAVNNGGQE